MTGLEKASWVWEENKKNCVTTKIQTLGKVMGTNLHGSVLFEGLMEMN